MSPTERIPAPALQGAAVASAVVSGKGHSWPPTRERRWILMKDGLTLLARWVHRFFFLTFTRVEWIEAIDELVRVTKPGGWIEIVEFDPILERPGPTCDRFLKSCELLGDTDQSVRPWLQYSSFVNVLLKSLVQTICEARDIHFEVGFNLPQLLGKLDNVHSDKMAATVGWNGRVGQLAAQNSHLIAMGLAEKLAPELGVSMEEYTQLAAKFIKECSEHKAWGKIPYAYGMKPLSSGVEHT
ncbi:hypothetical protein BC938DRAFT_477367 [Jimgerdemannia flammicorona]|uniref:Uncharacterized protein n=1 Tax=Jimgerdemannia flammicorona TaxID=994334 RepID=A0A433QPF8_9FUNG|nr:hypothetical protein BC938DRAFT_477367 [Jimgerdemannia flammicorona]